MDWTVILKPKTNFQEKKNSEKNNIFGKFSKFNIC
jgi:hypothetical protein